MKRDNAPTPIFKHAVIETKAAEVNPDEPLRFIASSEVEDRYGDIVRVDGWDLKSFRANPVVLFSHMHDSIVGTAQRVWVDGKNLMADIKLAAEGTSELVDSVRALVKQKILKAVSVGFMPHEYKEIRVNNSFAGYEFTKQELLEISIVSVPANPEALSVARALNLSGDLQSKLFRPSKVGQKTAARARVELEKLRVRG